MSRLAGNVRRLDKNAAKGSDPFVVRRLDENCAKGSDPFVTTIGWGPVQFAGEVKLGTGLGCSCPASGQEVKLGTGLGCSCPASGQGTTH